MVNSSFEAGNLNLDPKGYSIIGQSTNGNTKVTNESIHSGTLALKINDDNCSKVPNGCQLGISQSTTTTINGRDYILSVWVRTPDSSKISSSKLRLGIFGVVPSTDPNYGSNIFNIYSQDRYQDFDLSSLRNNEWTRFEVSFSNVPLGKYPIIEIINYKGGTIYADDADLNEGQSYDQSTLVSQGS